MASFPVSEELTIKKILNGYIVVSAEQSKNNTLYYPDKDELLKGLNDILQ